MALITVDMYLKDACGENKLFQTLKPVNVVNPKEDYFETLGRLIEDAPLGFPRTYG